MRVKISSLKKGDYFTFTKSYKAIIYVFHGFYGSDYSRCSYQKARTFKFFKLIKTSLFI